MPVPLMRWQTQELLRYRCDTPNGIPAGIMLLLAALAGDQNPAADYFYDDVETRKVRC